MDPNPFVPLISELLEAFARGVSRGMDAEFAKPSPSRASSPTAQPQPQPAARTAPTVRTSPPPVAGLKTAPEVGARVRYRQGRGAFEARVIEVAEDGAVTVERLADGRRVVRPFRKLERSALPESPRLVAVSPPPPEAETPGPADDAAPSEAGPPEPEPPATQDA